MAYGFGFGGLGSTYPTRVGSPTSQVVESLPFGTWDEYNTDWQKRYSALSGQATNPGTAEVRVPDSGGSSWNPWWQSANIENLGGGAGSTAAEKLANSYGLTLTRGPDGVSLGRAADAFTTVNTPGFTPDYSPLLAERDKMFDLYNKQAVQQQSYDAMRGNGQLNGMMGQDYSKPGFGQVTGAENPFAMPSGAAAAGVNTSGLYNAGAQSGVYSPDMASKRFWGL